MNSNRIFYVALVISAVGHGVVLLQSPHISFLADTKKALKIEVSYIKPPAPEKKIKTIDTPEKREPLVRIPPKITSTETKIALPNLQKDNFFKNNRAPLPIPRALFDKPAMTKPDVIAVTKKITVAPLETNKNTSPSYIAFSEAIHETIKRVLRLNYSGTETGIINVSFVIANNGSLVDVHIIEKDSSDSEYLRDLTLKGVRQAAPFPRFPKDLDYPQLTFNAIVSFQIE